MQSKKYINMVFQMMILKIRQSVLKKFVYEKDGTTLNFYKKCGYTATGKEHTPDFDLVTYEKVLE